MNRTNKWIKEFKETNIKFYTKQLPYALLTLGVIFTVVTVFTLLNNL